jgi:hypothetical protein
LPPRKRHNPAKAGPHWGGYFASVLKDSPKGKLMNSQRLALLSSEHASPLQLFVPSSLLFDRSGARNEIASFEAKRYSETNGRIDKDIKTVTLISGQETEREHHRDAPSQRRIGRRI